MKPRRVLFVLDSFGLRACDSLAKIPLNGLISQSLGPDCLSVICNGPPAGSAPMVRQYEQFFARVLNASLPEEVAA